MDTNFEVTDLLCTPKKAEKNLVRTDAVYFAEAQPVTWSSVSMGAGNRPQATEPFTQRFLFEYPAPGKHTSTQVPGELHTLLVPVKLDLAFLTVGDLVEELLKRLRRRYGASLDGYYPSCLRFSYDAVPYTSTNSAAARTSVDLPGQAEAEYLYRQMGLSAGGAEGGKTAGPPPRPYPLLSSASASEATDIIAARPFGLGSSQGGRRLEASDTCSVDVDAVMNAEDTLDSFIPPPWMPSASPHERNASRAVIRVRIPQWSETPTGSERVTSDKEEHIPQRLLSRSSLDKERDALALVSAPQLSLAASAAPMCLPMTQRSAYVDLLLLRRRQRQQDEASYGVGAVDFSVLDAQHVEDSEDDEDAGDFAEGSLARHTAAGAVMEPVRPRRRGKRAQLLYEVRLAYEAEEAASRALVEQQEAGEREVVVGRHDDSLPHLLTLEALQGDFTTNGRLASLLRKYRLYPLDTQPLAHVPSAEEKTRLTTNAENTALLSFQFLDAKPKPRKTDAELRMERLRAAYISPHDPLGSLVTRDGKPKSYRELMQEAVAHERALLEREAREEMRVEYFLERGEPLPPREPTPPPSPPTPRTPTLEELPVDVLADFMQSYTDGRHDIIRNERIVYRDMTGTMRSILKGQKEADSLAVAEAYLAERQVADNLFQFNFNAFHDMDLLAAEDLSESSTEATEQVEWVAQPQPLKAPLTTGEAEEEPEWDDGEIIYKQAPLSSA